MRLLRSVFLASAVGALIGGCQTTEAPQYSGADLYAGNCSVCHGVYAEGDGPAAALIAGSVPDLRQLAARNGGQFPRESVFRIVDGRDLSDAHAKGRSMPKWGEEFQLYEGYDREADSRVRAKIEALVDYLAQIQLPEN